MYTKVKKQLCMLMAVVMLFSVFPWSGAIVAAEESVSEQTTENKTQSGKTDTVAVTIENPLGNITLEQTQVNETNLTVTVANVNEILSASHADHIKITAKMYYKDTVTQNVAKTIPLVMGQSDYLMDFQNFGKYTVCVEFLKGSDSVTASENVTVGIVASAYNFAPISATFPAVLFSLSLWDGTDFNITKDSDGNSIPTFAVFERADSWDWSRMPENVYKLPTASDSDFSGVRWGGKVWLETRYKMASYIKDLYEISPHAVFNLYYTDNYVENMLLFLVANQIPESQYHVVLLSDGSGTYAYFNNTFKNDDGTLYNNMRADWETLKEKTREEGVFNPAWAKYANSSNLSVTCLPKYAAVAAEDENVDWWVARTNGTFSIENDELLTKVKDNCTVKGVSGMLSSVQATGHDKDFQMLYHFDTDMFGTAGETGKPVMLILGSIVSAEPDFKDYAKMVMQHYGSSYEYYYKGHPGTPTALHPSKQNELDELGITDVDSSIPAELILFFFPDIYMCGYDSSTFQSVESEQMACGMFNQSKSTILDTKTYGSMLDFFARKIDKTSEEFVAYTSLCTEPDHVYYLLEYNDTRNGEIAIYDADDRNFTYYKNVADAPDYDWSSEVMRNLTVSDIASHDYTGGRIRPEITVKHKNKTLQKGVDYTVSYGNNVLPGQGSVVIKGKGDYETYGSVTKFFIINKVANPLRVSCDNVPYGNEIKPEVFNPSLGELTYAYKLKDEADTSYTDVAPVEPGEYTLRVTSDYTACYNAATAETDFIISKIVPTITVWPSAGPIILGQSLSDSKLTEGQADVEGTFQWRDTTIKPLESDSNKTMYTLVFIPADTVHYNEVETSLSITVNSGVMASNAPQYTTTPVIKNGQKITVNKKKYVVKISTDAKKTVSVKFAGCTNARAKSVSIPKSISYQGVAYPVTEISAKALAGNKALSKVTIGASVTKIEKKAFYNCKNLKQVIIKSKKITVFGSNAFKGIHKKAKFTLPASKKKTYKKKIMYSLLKKNSI